MDKQRERKALRFGLQLKSVLILALLVLGVTLAGGWSYFDAARQSLRKSDLHYAGQLAKALGLAAQHDLRQGRDHALQRLVTDFLRNENVRYVALVDSRGMLVASACSDGPGDRWAHLAGLPAALTATEQTSDDLLVLASPIVLRDVVWWEQRLVGGVRVVFDTGATTARLARVQEQMLTVAAAIVLCAIPAGYLLVWHVMVKPVRRLAGLTARLARGDFQVRARLRRSDEFGRLGESFDAMASDLRRMHDELIEANEQLEQKVAERTEDLRHANGRLRAEMTEKDEFLRAVSHDLNAPLRNIAGMATMITMKWRDELPEEVLARLGRIQANVDVQTSLISELLELSRIRTRPQKRTVVDFGEMLHRLAEAFEYELKGRRIALEIAGDMPSLCVEPGRVRQVFQNLLDNAIKYMHRPEGGLIRLGYRRERRMHVFSVADNGPGIPPEQHERVFCVFRRGPGAAGGAGAEGKGVGLALVRGIVSNYNGRAWVESEPGRGATFLVSLDADSTRPSDEADPLENATVDDEDDIPADHHLAGR
ncbi:MAG TPA: HAMP domain-containing sensor histidine kinase [Phycisphaerae bacterium]|nr:HAMP domain-containing sensor histidine kinase [Phycisphaerae bacterium]